MMDQESCVQVGNMSTAITDCLNNLKGEVQNISPQQTDQVANLNSIIDELANLFAKYSSGIEKEVKMAKQKHQVCHAEVDRLRQLISIVCSDQKLSDEKIDAVSSERAAVLKRQVVLMLQGHLGHLDDIRRRIEDGSVKSEIDSLAMAVKQDRDSFDTTDGSSKDQQKKDPFPCELLDQEVAVIAPADVAIVLPTDASQGPQAETAQDKGVAVYHEDDKQIDQVVQEIKPWYIDLPEQKAEVIDREIANDVEEKLQVPAISQEQNEPAPSHQDHSVVIDIDERQEIDSSQVVDSAVTKEQSDEIPVIVVDDGKNIEDCVPEQHDVSDLKDEKDNVIESQNIEGSKNDAPVADVRQPQEANSSLEAPSQNDNVPEKKPRKKTFADVVSGKAIAEEVDGESAEAKQDNEQHLEDESVVQEPTQLIAKVEIADDEAFGSSELTKPEMTGDSYDQLQAGQQDEVGVQNVSEQRIEKDNVQDAQTIDAAQDDAAVKESFASSLARDIQEELQHPSSVVEEESVARENVIENASVEIADASQTDQVPHADAENNKNNQSDIEAKTEQALPEESKQIDAAQDDNGESKTSNETEGYKDDKPVSFWDKWVAGPLLGRRISSNVDDEVEQEQNNEQSKQVEPELQKVVEGDSKESNQSNEIGTNQVVLNQDEVTEDVPQKEDFQADNARELDAQEFKQIKVEVVKSPQYEETLKELQQNVPVVPAEVDKQIREKDIDHVTSPAYDQVMGELKQQDAAALSSPRHLESDQIEHSPQFDEVMKQLETESNQKDGRSNSEQMPRSQEFDQVLKELKENEEPFVTLHSREKSDKFDTVMQELQQNAANKSGSTSLQMPSDEKFEAVMSELKDTRDEVQAVDVAGDQESQYQPTQGKQSSPHQQDGVTASRVLEQQAEVGNGSSEEANFAQDQDSGVAQNEIIKDSSKQGVPDDEKTTASSTEVVQETGADLQNDKQLQTVTTSPQYDSVMSELKEENANVVHADREDVPKSAQFDAVMEQLKESAEDKKAFATNIGGDGLKKSVDYDKVMHELRDNAPILKSAPLSQKPDAEAREDENANFSQEQSFGGNAPIIEQLQQSSADKQIAEESPVVGTVPQVIEDAGSKVGDQVSGMDVVQEEIKEQTTSANPWLQKSGTQIIKNLAENIEEWKPVETQQQVAQDATEGNKEVAEVLPEYSSKEAHDAMQVQQDQREQPAEVATAMTDQEVPIEQILTDQGKDQSVEQMGLIASLKESEVDGVQQVSVDNQDQIEVGTQRDDGFRAEPGQVEEARELKETPENRKTLSQLMNDIEKSESLNVMPVVEEQQLIGIQDKDLVDNRDVMSSQELAEKAEDSAQANQDYTSASIKQSEDDLSERKQDDGAKFLPAVVESQGEGQQEDIKGQLKTLDKILDECLEVVNEDNAKSNAIIETERAAVVDQNPPKEIEQIQGKENQQEEEVISDEQLQEVLNNPFIPDNVKNTVRAMAEQQKLKQSPQQEELKQLRDENQKLQQELNQRDEEIAQLKDDNQNLDKYASQLEDENDQLKQQELGGKVENQKLRSALQAVKDELSDMHTKLPDAVTGVPAVKRQVIDMEALDMIGRLKRIWKSLMVLYIEDDHLPDISAISEVNFILDQIEISIQIVGSHVDGIKA
ncbi:hypothetical protein MIR68_000570 [Amoeboaphelidium protococcarum]|nr:hypothetical protein MIR68_000570 [Amoeboaphelidium protococcarum]